VNIRDIDFLLIGGGLASVTAAETIRREGGKGSILILSEEEVAPYRRPSLSKRYLLGTVTDAQILIHPESFYHEHAIELQLNARVVAVDPEKQIVAIESGEKIRYGKLLIATGVTPEQLSVPGALLDGVYSLRRKSDCDAIRFSAAKAKKVVVLGGNFVGMEVAMSLIDLGLEVTIVERCDRILPYLAAANLSEYFRKYAETRGVSIILEDTASELHGLKNVEEVETAAGRHLPCDLVIVAIGVVPVTKFLARSGIDLDQGLIVVDDLLRTSVPNVFAAGDATSFYDPVFAQRRHIEHWDNAVKQGRLAGRNMLGQRVRYDEVSCFFSEIGDISFDVLGKPEEADEWIERGTLDARSFALFYIKDNLPSALFSIGRPVEETRAVERLVRYRISLRTMKDKLSDPCFSLETIRTQTVLILQGGGAMGAFECGVVKALEERDIFPDVVAGVSIGALNGAIVASNPRHATAALEAFWADLTIKSPWLASSEARRSSTAMMTLMFGVPNFFKPRWFQPFVQMSDAPDHWTSYYDTAPMKDLIAKYVDFGSLKRSPVRLLISAVNVATAQLETFDSYVDDLTPAHILASGSLPPGFSWTMIDGQAYWDGGIISNSPLDLVIDRCGLESKRVFIVDLFADQKPLPTNLMDVMARRDEIVYSERIRSDMRTQEIVAAYRSLVEEVLSFASPEASNKIKQRPRYVELMGDDVPISITRFMRQSNAGDKPWHDYDFSQDSIELNQAEGYALVKKTLQQT
jgi:NTE family protein